MDTEEHIEIKESISKGHPVTDEGPYYHDSWWDSYKGSVKGKLGGAAIGTMVGGAVGAVAAAALVGTGLLAVSPLLLIGGFATGGLIYGAEEFSMVGKVTGAVANAQENAEKRQSVKFGEIKKGLAELQHSITGKPIDPKLLQDPDVAAAESAKVDDYRTTHFEESGDHPDKGMPVFWKVALIGLLVGAAAGALFAFSGGAAMITEAVGEALGAAAGSASTPALYATSMATFGLFGASFGINRDYFRQVFDKTDLLFRGIVPGQEGGKTIETPIVARSSAAQPPITDHALQEPPISTIIYDTMDDYPRSDTYHRDRVLASARQALLSMDHTKSVPH